MIPGLALTAIMARWRDRLRDSAALADFCQSRYGKPPAIFVGIDPAAPPAESDCPYIAIQTGYKIEGTDWKHYRYAVSVRWAVVNPAKTTIGGVTELDGIYDADQLGQIILSELAQASPSQTIGYVKYYPLTAEALQSAAYGPKFEGGMEIKVYVTPAMGGVINY